MATVARWPRRTATCLALLASSAFVCVASSHAADPDKSVDKLPTASPIKHVIIIVGENRGFDHLFATYVPKGGGERVRNLLSEGIINADGSAGPNFARAQQFRITAPPNGPGNFFISAGAASKLLYSFLPTPDVAGVQNPPDTFILGIPCGDPGLPASAQFLYGTGGTGLSYTLGAGSRALVLKDDSASGSISADGETPVKVPRRRLPGRAPDLIPKTARVSPPRLANRTPRVAARKTAAPSDCGLLPALAENARAPAPDCRVAAQARRQ